MNDLMELKEAWGQPDPPSPAAASAARAALMRQIAAAGSPEPAPVRRWRGARVGWLFGGTAVAALAAAVALAVSPGGVPTAPRPGQVTGPRPGQVTGLQSGQQILLAAADVAETGPAGTGMYWHVKQTMRFSGERTQTLETFTTRDGTQYTLPEGYTGVLQTEIGTGFQVGLSRVTLAQLQQLPTDPAKLTAWIRDSFAHADRPADGLPADVAYTLSRLLWEVPAPPALRAAALRGLAAMPNVTNLGPADGGVALRIAIPPPPAAKFPNGQVPAGSDRLTLVIDPATATLLSQTNYQGTISIGSAGWTNQMPKVTSPPHK